jgi:hypothetical protein
VRRNPCLVLRVWADRASFTDEYAMRAPRSSSVAYVGRWDSERQRLLFLAFALLVADVLVTALIFSYETYEKTARALGG